MNVVLLIIIWKKNQICVMIKHLLTVKIIVLYFKNINNNFKRSIESTAAQFRLDNCRKQLLNCFLL